MKDSLRRLFYPILRFFENDSDEFNLTSTNRKVALFISTTFVIIALLLPVIASGSPFTSYIFPVIVFGSIGFIGLVVGSLGSDHAVAKLVGNRAKL